MVKCSTTWRFLRSQTFISLKQIRRAGTGLVAAVTALLQATCATADRSVSGSTAHEERSTLPISTRDLVELVTMSGLRVSPDERFAVIREERQSIASGATHMAWRVIDLNDGRTSALVDAGGVLWNNNGGIASEAPAWSPSGDWIYFRKLVGEQVQVWRAHRDGEQASQVTIDDADVYAFDVNPDGSLTYAVAGATRAEIKQAEDAEHDSGILMGPTVISGFRVTHGFPVNGRMASYRHIENAMSGRRGTLLAARPPRVMNLPRDSTQPVPLSGEASLSFLAGRTIPLGPQAIPATFPSPREVSGDGQLIAGVSGRDRAPASGAASSDPGQHVWWTRREGSPAARTQCLDPICRHGGTFRIAGWRPDQHELILQNESLGVYRLIAWDTASNRVRLLAEGEGVIGSEESGTAGSCELTADKAICIAASSNRPPRLVSIDLTTGHINTLHDPNPELSEERLGDAKLVPLVDRFGNTTIGTVILPKGRPGAVRLPLVITSYSCRGFLQGGSGRDVPEHVLASLGYAAVCVDMGRMVEYVPGFNLTPATASASSLDFFEQAVDVLSGMQIIDPTRVVISGFSATATHATATLTKSRKFTAAIVTTGGSFDAIACYLAANYRSCEARAKREGFERPYDARDGFLRSSPAWNAEKIITPLLMQLPETEYASMMQLYGALMAYNRPVEMYVFAGAYHYKNNPRQRLTVYDRNVDWIEFWLKGVESRRTGSADQNARWRQMRAEQCASASAEEESGGAMWYCESQ